MMYSKKGFSANQMFVFAISLVILGLVLFMGVKFVGVLNSRSCEFDIAEAVNTLEGRVDEVSHNYGSEKQLSLGLPCSAQQVCIAQLDASDKASVTSYLQTLSPLAADSYADDVNNVFFLEDTKVVHSFRLDSIVVSNPLRDGILCIDYSPAVFRLRGLGKQAEISSWS